MPSLGYGGYAEKVAMRKARVAKLRKLGIIEGSRKWNSLLYRRNF